MPYHTNGNNNGTRENLYTGGGEYMCQTNNYPGCGNGPNGTYVGPMHYHPSKGYMAGATHSEQSHPILMPVYNTGGMLRGPSHANGGIPASVAGGEMIELEGGEFIINAQTAKAVGEGFLNKLNSTATTHHVGGYQQGQLPSPSMYRNGGKVPNRRNKMRRGGRPTRKTSPTTMGRQRRVTNARAAGKKTAVRGRNTQMARGGVVRGRGRKMQYGGTATSMTTNRMNRRSMMNTGRLPRSTGTGQVVQNGNKRQGNIGCPNPGATGRKANYVNFIETPLLADGTKDYYCCLEKFRTPECEKKVGRNQIEDLIYARMGSGNHR